MDAVQFYVIVSFRPGSEPAITQSGTPLRVTSAGPTLMPEITVPARTPIEQSLRAREMELRAVLRELTRIQAQMTPGGPDTVRLQQEITSLMEQVSRVERALRDAGLASGPAPAPPEATPAAPPQGRLLAPSGRIPLRVGGAIPGPRARVTPKATYSSEAMDARVEGTVAVDALVDEEGRVADARVIRSIPLLDESAIASARQWRFTPTVINGELVPVIVRLEISFTLRD